MKQRLSLFIAVTGLATLAPSAFAANEKIAFSSITNAFVQFVDTGTGPGAGVDFSFTPDPSFIITSATGFGGANSITGLQGAITGTFNFLNSGISGSTTQQAAVTGTGTFIIHDGTNDFTATLNWDQIATIANGGLIFTQGTVDLSNFQYSGTNDKLLELKSQPGGSLVASFTFDPAKSLQDLTSDCATAASCQTSFSGTATASPEPGFYGSLALGFAGLVFAVQTRRRKTAA